MDRPDSVITNINQINRAPTNVDSVHVRPNVSGSAKPANSKDNVAANGGDGTSSPNKASKRPKSKFRLFPQKKINFLIFKSLDFF